MKCPHCGGAIADAREPSHQPLTKKQRDIFLYIEAYTRRHAISPSFEEIAKAFDLASLATVHEHIENMSRKKVLRRAPGSTRSIALLVRSDELASVGGDVSVDPDSLDDSTDDIPDLDDIEEEHPHAR
jgi:repressor LexA